MDLNTEIFYFINNDLSNPVFDAVLPNFTHLGGLMFLAVLFAILLIITRQNIFNTRKYYGLVKLIAAAIIVMFAITSILKLLFHMPRPYMILDHVKHLGSGGISSSSGGYWYGERYSGVQIPKSIARMVFLYIQNHPCY